MSIVDRTDFYERNPENKERTKKRLQEMEKLGMEEFSVASFGIEGIMSGFYIEQVWSYSDEDFKSYMDWVRNLIKEKTK